MSWLMSNTAVPEVEQKKDELRQQIEKRQVTAETVVDQVQPARITDRTNPQLALLTTIVGNALTAGNALQREWFCDSVGIDWGGGDREMWYVSRAPVAATFAGEQVVHWTHWVGRVCTQIREHLAEHGTFPELVCYGPPNKPPALRAVEPWVRYQFANGRLLDHEFRDASGATPATPARETPAEEPPPAEGDASPAFGLKDIVQLRDLDQDDRIRGPMAGTHLLTGGPGVGKTTVALHRIPYLLLQQVSQLPVEAPDAPSPFFREETMHVVVWKEHLVPYLSSASATCNSPASRCTTSRTGSPAPSAAGCRSG